MLPLIIAGVGIALLATGCGTQHPDETGIDPIDTDPDDDTGTQPTDDVDGDGYVAAEDCDDSDASLQKILSGYKDQDLDGATVGEYLPETCVSEDDPRLEYYTQDQSLVDDCDDSNPETYQYLPAYLDEDGDTFYSEISTPVCSGEAVSSEVSQIATPGDDCDDTSAAIYPSDEAEAIVGRDTNCDGIVDANADTDAVQFVGGESGDLMGKKSLAVADVNGDGFADIAAGSGWQGYGYWGQNGIVDLTFGSRDFFDNAGATPTSFDSSPVLIHDIYSDIGVSMASAKLNGDGMSELLLGAPIVNADGFSEMGIGDDSDSGGILVAYGRASWDAEYDLEGSRILTPSVLSAYNMALITGPANSLWGGRVYVFNNDLNEDDVIETDVNGDGFGEIATAGGDGVGQIDFVPAENYPSGEVTSTTYTLRIADDTDPTLNGYSDLGDHVSIGDVDGDGYGDILVASSYYLNSEDVDVEEDYPRGRAWLIFGGPELDALPENKLYLSDIASSGLRYRTFTGAEVGYGAGSSVAINDNDHDGIADEIIIGAKYDSSETDNGGIAYKIPTTNLMDSINGTPSGDNSLYLTENGDDVELDGDVTDMGGNKVYISTSGVELSAALLSADTDGDSFDDFLITSSASGLGYYYNGWDLYGVTDDLDAIDAPQEVSASSSDSFGDYAVKGDINGDGAEDVVISDPYGSDGAGVVYAFAGRKLHP